jgi:hypothetical protein
VQFCRKPEICQRPFYFLPLPNMRSKFLLLVTTASVLSLTACIDEASQQTKQAIANAGEAGDAADKAMNDAASYTQIEWIDSVKNMGTISEGQKLEVVFRFRNVGNHPLVIKSADPSCGCTVPEKPEAPVMPGNEGLIKAVFSSDGRPGTNHKTISVKANTLGSQDHVLEFNVEVTPKKENATAAVGGTAF